METQNNVDTIKIMQLRRMMERMRAKFYFDTNWLYQCKKMQENC